MKKIDWSTGAVGNYCSLENSQSLIFCSDWAPIRTHGKIVTKSPGTVYSPALLDVLKSADYRIINIEAVLSKHPEQLKALPKEGGSLIGHANAVEDLMVAGFDIGLIGNNHAYDFGYDGLLSTRNVLESAGLRTCGSGTNQSDAYDGLVLECGKHSVAIVNFQEGEEGTHTYRAPELAGWDIAKVCQSIQRHVENGRIVIAVPHADREFLPVPAPYVQKTYRQLVEAGASLVIAHHPHVPRGLEIYREVPIFYSQGNFVFSHEHPGLFRRLGFMLEVLLRKDGEIACKMIPYHIGQDSIDLLNTEQKAWFFSKLEIVSEDWIQPNKVLSWWNAAIDAIPLDSWYHSCTGMDYGMNLMRQKDPIGLARLRTRLSSPSHYEFIVSGINRILAGEHGTSSSELIETVLLWTDQPASDFPLFGNEQV